MRTMIASGPGADAGAGAIPVFASCTAPGSFVGEGGADAGAGPGDSTTSGTAAGWCVGRGVADTVAVAASVDPGAGAIPVFASYPQIVRV